MTQNSTWNITAFAGGGSENCDGYLTPDMHDQAVSAVLSHLPVQSSASDLPRLGVTKVSKRPRDVLRSREAESIKPTRGQKAAPGVVEFYCIESCALLSTRATRCVHVSELAPGSV
jgi:hypothetical protein